MKKWLGLSFGVLAVLALGLFLVHCNGGDGGGCKGEADCPNGFYCDMTTHECVCSPQCTNKCCGPDGCDGDGTCSDNCAGDTPQCNQFSCECEPGPDCTTGDTQCDGTVIQNCVAGEWQNGDDCADDNETCQAGACVCIPDCGNRVCGMDPACGTLSCGTCPAGQSCTDAGQCQDCTPNCTGLVCGPDPVCDQSCGTCDPGYTCDDGACISMPGDECPGGDPDCPDEWPTCLEFQDGSTYCSMSCAIDADCGGDPNCCHDFGGDLFCADQTICPGASGAGDPCPFDGLNDDADNCDAALMCLGQGPSADIGTCSTAGDCTDAVGAERNPDCVGGECGASFCSEECGPDRACPEGFTDTDVDTTCYCIPEVIFTECTDPVNNIGCDAGYKCMAWEGSMSCVEEGPIGHLQPCGPAEGYCVAGMLCLSFGGGPYLCQEYCNATEQTGCSGECDDCWPEEPEPWGLCYPLDCCDMTVDDTGQCDVGFNGDVTLCSLSDPENDCSVACWPSGGLGLDETCVWDDCGPNLFCTFYLTDMSEEDSGVCLDRCDTSDSDCTGGDTCGHIDALTGCDGFWGICSQ